MSNSLACKAHFELSKSKALAQLDFLKKQGLKVSYSLKTNIEVGKLLERESDCMFSVHAFEELKALKDYSRVWFLSQGWNSEEVQKLFDLGVSRFVVDNEQDLKILEDFLKEKKKKAELLLRLRLRENTIFTEKYYAFGMSASKVEQNITRLKNSRLFEKIGLHFHRKTQNVSEWALKEELENTLGPDVFGMIDFLNIGGGLPVDYRNSRATPLLDGILKHLKDLKKFCDSKKITLIIEPGRFIAAPCVKLKCFVKAVLEDSVIVDASVYNSSMDTLIVPVKLLVDGELENGVSYTIKGCTPCSLDIFRYRVFFGKPLKVGDCITFLNAGAYNFSTEFCELPKLETIVVD